MGAVFGLAINVRDLPSSAIKWQVAELRDLGHLFLGDYYQLKSALFVYERVRQVVDRHRTAATRRSVEKRPESFFAIGYSSTCSSV